MTGDEIAIVGAGCRFPGADDLDEFWKVLENGENHVTDIPESRWNNAAFYDEDKNVPGKTYVKKAGLLKNHDAFDNRLFGISDAEASRVDPQQRYVLECVHMALEDGGITRKQLNGSNTGVIIGCMNDDYKVMVNSELEDIGSYNATGTSTSVISARVSYVYNLHGTCLTLDTACSSALVAIHLASQAIKTGDCDMMICGGVSSILVPDIFVALCKARMMSATGQCQSFCDTADGYARGEGCGIVVLKSLKAAVQDGNKIWATIKTGSNQDGCITKPMTAPSGVQQLELLKQVYRLHQYNPSDIQYIEAHGTGTPIGDPTELNALGSFFSSARNSADEALLVGSVKSNIGHIESAAGVAGLLKVLLMMKHAKYVPSLHVKPDKSNVNSNIQLKEYNIDIATSVQEWPCDMNGERHACLNSFGFGGSNIHAIITQKKAIPDAEHMSSKSVAVCISGVDKESLKLNLLQFSKDLDDNKGLHSQDDIAFTSLNHRDIFPFRTLVFGNDIPAIKEDCKRKIGRINEVAPKKKHNKVFVYCGVGTTWTGMCKEFMDQNDVFRNTVDRIDYYLKDLTGWTIAEKFQHDTDYSDPFLNHIAIFSAQVALTEVWKSFNVFPDIIVGQSVGEVAAAYAADLLTLDEAVRVIYHRSDVLSKQSEGAMTVIGNLDTEQVETMCSKYDDKVCIAVYSSPVACTISGSKGELKQLTDDLQQDEGLKNVFIRELKVQCAYHSPLLQSCVEEVEQRVDGSFSESSSSSIEQTNSNSTPMISTVTGNSITQTEAKSGKYWADNIRQPVLFMQSIKQAFDDDSCNIYVEIGPRPVLKAHISNIFESGNAPRTIPTMSSNSEIKCLYGSLAELFELGVDIHVPVFGKLSNRPITKIPRYTFYRKENLYIPSTKRKALDGFEARSSSSHMFVETSKSSKETEFSIRIDKTSTPFVYDHFLSDRIIVPGATYVETGFHIGVELLKQPVESLSVAFNFVKTFSPKTGRQHKLNVDVTSKKEDVQFSVLHDTDILANGTVAIRSTPVRDAMDIEELKLQCPIFKTKSECYESLKKFNFRYGDSLSLIQRSWSSDKVNKCLTEIRLPDSIWSELTKTRFHPAIIDSVFQIFGILVNETEQIAGEIFVVPKGVETIVLNKPVERVMYGYGEQVHSTSTSRHYNAVLISTGGAVIAEMENFYTQVISNASLQPKSSYAYALNWSEVSESYYSNTPQPDRIVLYSTSPSDWLLELGKAVTVIHETDIEHGFTEKVSLTNTALVYHVGGNTADDMKSSNTKVLDGALKRFLDLKKIVTILKESKIEIPITVVTENTQMCPGRQIVNYNGSELWGMLRSAVHEGFYKDIKLLDIDQEHVDITTVLEMLSSVAEKDIEYALFGSKIYKPKVELDSKKAKAKRRVAVPSSEKLAIYTRKAFEETKPYLMLSNETTYIPNTVSISLTNMTIHDKNLYLPALYDIRKIDIKLRKEEDDDCQIVALEGRGIIEHTKREVFFLYPVNAWTTVHVPKKNLIDVKDCPSYISGILILTHVLVHLATFIKAGTPVMTLNESQTTDVGQELFTHILKRKSCKTEFCTNTYLLTKRNFSHVHTLIIFTAVSVEKLRIYLASFPNLRRIISLTIFFPEHLKVWVYHQYPEIQTLVLSTAEILSTTGLKGTVPMVKECLQKFRPSNISEKTSSFLFKLPMKDVPVRKKLQEGSLECFCWKSDIFRSQACYIVIGGLTGLGWELLQLMAEMGAGILVTLSRRSPSDTMKANMEELQQRYHCLVVHVQADISDFKSVENAFSQILRQFPNHPIKGIFHGAGFIADSILENLEEGKVVDVMKPKVLGVWNLHLASLDLPIDYFVIHSSVVSVIGNTGQCNYAAANSFLDSFASYRRSKGLPAQSINWGALAVGMAAENDEIIEQLKRKGFYGLEKDKIRDLFLEALTNDSTNIIYADIKWSTLLSIPTFSKQVSKYSRFHITKVSSKKTTQFDVEEFRKLDSNEQYVRIKDFLKEKIHEVFMTEKDSLTDETSLTDIGIDSMSAMSLSNLIDDEINCRIPIVALLSGETTLSTLTEDVVQYLIDPNVNEFKSSQMTIGQNSEFAEFFGSDDITFMQRHVLERYKKNRDDPYFLRVVDVELIGLKASVDHWKNLLKVVLEYNPELRKKFSFSEDGDISVVNVSEDEDPVVSSASGEKLALEESEGTDVRMNMSADINNSHVIWFKIAETEKGTILRLIVHAVAIDMRGISMILRDIEIIGHAYGNGEDMPPKRPTVDVVNVVRRSILPRMKELAAYWDTYLNRDISPITLGQKLEKVDPKLCKVSFVDIPAERVVVIQNYISKLGISLYEFLMSVYQLYLYIGSNCKTITVGTATDMRFHVPELNHVITRCVNYIPIIAEIDENYTVTKYIQENSTQLSSTTRHGAFPTLLIEDKLESKEMKENVFRHFLSMNDLKDVNRVKMQDENRQAEIRRVWIQKPDRETFMFVNYDLTKSWVKFEIGHNTEICGQYGDNMSDMLFRLMDMAVQSVDKTIGNIRIEMLAWQESEEKNALVKIGDEQYLKEGSVTCNSLPVKSKDVYGVRSGENLEKSPMYTKGNVGEHQINARRSKADLINEANMGLNGTSLTEKKKVMLSDRFEKQTSHGWDHTVHVTLNVVDGNRVMLEWGKKKRLRKRIDKTLDLTKAKDVVLRKWNGLQLLVVDTGYGKLLLKTPYRPQAERWMECIQQSFNNVIQ